MQKKKKKATVKNNVGNLSISQAFFNSTFPHKDNPDDDVSDFITGAETAEAGETMGVSEAVRELNQLDENKSTRVKSALFGDVTSKIKTFAILTAENPGDKQFSAEENNKRNDRLKRMFKQMGIQYVPFQGMFNRKEHSFIAFNLSLEDAKRLCYLEDNAPKEEYQQSFFFGRVFEDGSEITYYEMNDKGDYVPVETSDRVDNAKDFDNFFSRYHDFKFSIYMKIFNESISGLSDITDEAVDDSFTAFHRMKCRRNMNNIPNRLSVMEALRELNEDTVDGIYRLTNVNSFSIAMQVLAKDHYILDPKNAKDTFLTKEIWNKTGDGKWELRDELTGKLYATAKDVNQIKQYYNMLGYTPYQNNEGLETAEKEIICEAGLSRILQHTKDKTTFAVIGSQDKDTKEDRYQELISEIRKIAGKGNKIGYNNLEGTYTYDDGTVGVESSVIIYNISKEDALRIANKLNQESIIWKDDNFFGFLTADGKEDGELGRGISLDKEAVKSYGSKLKGKHNNAKGFVFEMLVPTNRGSNFSKQNKSKINRYKIIDM